MIVRRVRMTLSSFRDRALQSSPADLALLAVPVAGAAATELAPNRQAIDPKAAAVMVATAAVNALGEELLWRGSYLDWFPDDPWRGAAWPWIGFTVWHLAPQVILPSRRGRVKFLVGAGLVGAAPARVARTTRSLRWTLLAHVLTDARAEGCSGAPSRGKENRDVSDQDGGHGMAPAGHLPPPPPEQFAAFAEPGSSRSSTS
jgi:Type II CAAX prenyl endopeptidase Rce1-like